MRIQDQRPKLVIGHAESGNMKASEFITEGKAPPKRYKEATRGLHKFGLDGDRYYELYRVMLAAASSNGVDEIPDHVDPESWAARGALAIPLTQQEQQMLEKAYKKIGSKYKDLNHGDLRSMELKIVNKTSPVAKRKPNKYGV